MAPAASSSPVIPQAHRDDMERAQWELLDTSGLKRMPACPRNGSNRNFLVTATSLLVLFQRIQISRVEIHAAGGLEVEFSSTFSPKKFFPCPVTLPQNGHCSK